LARSSVFNEIAEAPPSQLRQTTAHYLVNVVTFRLASKNSALSVVAAEVGAIRGVSAIAPPEPDAPLARIAGGIKSSALRSTRIARSRTCALALRGASLNNDRPDRGGSHPSARQAL
jgi:hypothetical protein